MASGPHTFAILGVFSAEQFKGNRLAVVAVRANSLTLQKKALIAKEFGFTGTVFIHDAAGPGIPRRIELFSEKGEEMAFSGHCVLGTAHYIFLCCDSGVVTDPDKPLTTVLMTKSGPVSVLYNTRRQVAACSIPHGFHVHKSKVTFDKVLNVQPHLQIVPTIGKCKEQTSPVVSIVKGMTFSLIDLTETPEVLAALEASKAPEVELDIDWTPSYVGALFYKKKDALIQSGEPTIHSIQARVIANGVEDAGTGSACSALACYLALNEDIASGVKPNKAEASVQEVTAKAAETSLEDKQSFTQRHIYAIQQGLEIGKGCTIAVEVELSLDHEGKKSLKTVTLSGRASLFARGELIRG